MHNEDAQVGIGQPQLIMIQILRDLRLDGALQAARTKLVLDNQARIIARLEGVERTILDEEMAHTLRDHFNETIAAVKADLQEILSKVVPEPSDQSDLEPDNAPTA